MSTEADPKGVGERPVWDPVGPLRGIRAIVRRTGLLFTVVVVAAGVGGAVLSTVASLLGWSIGSSLGGFLVEFAVWYSRPFFLVLVLAYLATVVVDLNAGPVQ